MNLRTMTFYRAAKLVKAVSTIKGAGKAARKLNELALWAGVDPIQIAQMRDGTLIRVDLRSRTEHWSFYSGTYDEKLVGLLVSLLNEWPGSFLDVGANIGMYAVRIAARTKEAHSFLCVEPNPSNAARIRENALLNDVSEKIDVAQLALSDQDGTATLVLREDFKRGASTGNASIAISEEADEGFQSIRIQTYRFDDYLAKEWRGEDFMCCKVDIEGHEDAFLRGSTDWLNRCRPVILTEINNWYYEKRGVRSSDVFGQALPEGYIVFRIEEGRGKARAVLQDSSELHKLSRLENCLLCPAEKAERCRLLIEK